MGGWSRNNQLQYIKCRHRGLFLSSFKVSRRTGIATLSFLHFQEFNVFLQGCGSGLDPDSVTLWIRIRIGNPDPGARK
jgi:hypothetical protein